MNKKLYLLLAFFVMLSTLVKAEDCEKFDKLSKEYAKCNADLIKKKTSEKINEGKKKFNSSKLKDTLIKFKNSKTHKEFMEKMKNDN